ncbi:MAG: DNA alkylation repair protein [Leptospiraceae bacterium]|nr:DNA alkylation repair protein [Leptospiraceae bacterium]MCZ8346671.1 DNA alkylation repair protein [Leptospiraceae bacterium]
MKDKLFSLKEIELEINSYKNSEQAKLAARYFKTAKGEYAEGDRFLGISVPVQRSIARKYANLSLRDIIYLLQSDWHEIRLIALFLLEHRYSHPHKDPSFQNSEQIVTIRKEVYDSYLANFSKINNWDLVDASAYKIIGRHLYDKDRSILYQWARSKILWERRIAIIATFYFIQKMDFEDTFSLSELLLDDKEDLMHKACGWMLREIYKKDSRRALAWTEKFKLIMPRTMLRYAIEKVPEKKRKQILNAK